MVTTISIIIGKDHFVRCSTEVIARDGEGLVHRFAIEIPENFAELWAYLDFKLPNGEKYKTARLPIENNLITYDIPAYVLNGDGVLKVQLVLQDGNGLVWKSNPKKFTVRGSINAVDDIPDKEDFIAEAQRILDEIQYGDNVGGSTVNVKQLNITGDGTPEDIKKIQDAINTYSTIVFPEGVYRVKGLTITKSNTKIVGENATLKIADGAEMNTMAGGTYGSVGLYIYSNDPTKPVSNIVIDGINFDGNGQWYLNNGRDPTDRRGDGTCVRMYNTENVTIRNCRFDNYIRRGIGTSVLNYDEDHTHFGVHGLNIINCEFNREPLPSKYVTIPDNVKYPDGKNAAAGIYKIYAISNAIQLLQTGKDAKDTDVLVENCTVHKSPNYGFMFYPLKENLTVRNCRIENCGLITSEDVCLELDGKEYKEKLVDGKKVYADYGYYYTGEGNDYDKADHCDGGGIKLNNPHNAIVEGCYIYGVRGSNISVHNATTGAGYKPEMVAAWGGAQDVVIRDNAIIGNPNQLRTGHGITVEGGVYVRIVGNTIINQVGAKRSHAVHSKTSYEAVKAIVSNAPLHIEGNIIENKTATNNEHGGINLYSGEIINNTITNAKIPIYAKTVGDKNAENLIISGNKIGVVNMSLGKPNGIDIQIVSDVIVSENIFTGLERGVRIYNSSKNVSVFGNVFKNCNRAIMPTVVDTMEFDEGTKTLSAPQILNGSKTTLHDNINIYGNLYTKNGAIQTSGTVVWEISGHKELVGEGDEITAVAVSHKFIPENAKVDFAPVT